MRRRRWIDVRLSPGHGSLQFWGVPLELHWVRLGEGIAWWWEADDGRLVLAVVPGEA
jgi:hypothetical protein